MKKIFVVGATGGLGQHVLKGLLEHSVLEVVAFARTPSKLDHLLCERLRVVQGDFSSLTSAHLRGIDLIIAAHSSATKERHLGYEALVTCAAEAGVPRIIGVGGAGQLLLENGNIKQSDTSWFPGLRSVTEDHQRGLTAVRESPLQCTWLAPPYMPTNAASKGGYVANNDTWNGTGMLPQVDVAQFIVDEALAPKHLGHVVGLSAV